MVSFFIFFFPQRICYNAGRTRKKQPEKWNRKNHCQDELDAHFWYECWQRTFQFWRDRREVPFLRICQMAANSKEILSVRQVVNFHRFSLQAGSIDGFCVWKTDVVFTVCTQNNKISLSCQPVFKQTQREIIMCCCWFFCTKCGKTQEKGI